LWPKKLLAWTFNFLIHKLVGRKNIQSLKVNNPNKKKQATNEYTSTDGSTLNLTEGGGCWGTVGRGRTTQIGKHAIREGLRQTDEGKGGIAIQKEMTVQRADTFLKRKWDMPPGERGGGYRLNPTTQPLTLPTPLLPPCQDSRVEGGVDRPEKSSLGGKLDRLTGGMAHNHVCAPMQFKEG